MSAFMTMLIDGLKEILGSTKTQQRPMMLTPSIKGAFHLALIGRGWAHVEGRYQKPGYYSNRAVPMADAIRAEKRLG